MPIDLTPMKASGKSRTPLEKIDPDVVEAIESAYTYCQTSDERLSGQFESQDAADEFLHQARSYAYQREAGRLVVTGNSTQKGQARFRVELYVKPTEDETSETPA